MADRHTLSISKLNDFRELLVQNGWIIEPLKGYYEVLRARKANKRYSLIIYKKDSAIQHLTVCDSYLYLVRNYIKERKYDNTV